MKYPTEAIALVLSIACLSADAFAPTQPHARSTETLASDGRIPKVTTATINSRSRSTSRLFSQWDDEESPSSFFDAGQAIGKEDEKQAMNDMGDFDTNKNYQASDVDRYRAAIAKRTEKMGLKKRTPEEIAAYRAEQEAKAAAARDQAGDAALGGMVSAVEDQKKPEDYTQMLDLSQISDEGPRGPDENLPAMLYDPSADMTEDEMKEADPTGYMPIPDQVKSVWDKTVLPSFGVVITEAAFVIITVIVTAVGISTWDDYCRNLAVEYQGIPTPEDVAKSVEGLGIAGEDVLGMGKDMSGADMLKMLQEGTQEISKSVQDGTFLEKLANAGDVPSEL